MPAHPTRRQALRRRVVAPSDRPHRGHVVTAPGPGAGRTGASGWSPSARRKGDWDVPFRILSTATLRAQYSVLAGMMIKALRCLCWVRTPSP